MKQVRLLLQGCGSGLLGIMFAEDLLDELEIGGGSVSGPLY